MIKRNLRRAYPCSLKGLDNHTEELNNESRTYKIVFIGYISLIVIVLMSGCLNKENKSPSSTPEENSNITPSMEKTTPLAAWIDDGGQKRDVKANVSTVDGLGVVLREKQVPLDHYVNENLYVAFNDENLSGYDIFTITPGWTLGEPIKTIEIDYIGLRKEGDKTFLDILFKTNHAFDFNVGLGFTRDASFSNIYPISSDKAGMGITVNAVETSDWQKSSFEITSAMKEEFNKIGTGILFLEKLDQNWHLGDRFVWDENKISQDSASKISGEIKSSFGVPAIRLLAYGKTIIEMSLNPPVLSQRIVVVTKNNTREEGSISITFK